MVNISQYVPQVSSQSIGLQESGGNGYIGNQALGEIGQVIGGNIDKSLKIDEQSLANKQQANIDSQNLVTKRMLEADERLAKQQDFKIKTDIHGSIIDTTFNLETKLKDLQNKTGAGAKDYFKNARKLIDESFSASIEGLQGENFLFAQSIAQKQKYRLYQNAQKYETEESVAHTINNVQKILDTNNKMLQVGDMDYNSALQNNTQFINQIPNLNSKQRQAMHDSANNQTKNIFLQKEQAQIDKLITNWDYDTASKILSDKKYQEEMPIDFIVKNQQKLQTEQLKQNELLINDAPAFFEQRQEKTGTTYDINDVVDTQIKIARQKGDTMLSPNSVSVLSAERAKDISMRMEQSQNPDEVRTLLSSIKQSSGDYYPNAIRDLKNNGLPKEYSFLTMMNPETDIQESDLFFNAIKTPKDEFKNNVSVQLNADGLKSADLQTSIDTAIQPFLNSMVNQSIGYTGIAEMRNNAQYLAMSHYAKYGDAEKSAEFAKTFLEKRNPIVLINGWETRIPKEYEPETDNIKNGLDILLSSQDISSYIPNEVINDVNVMKFKQSSYWAMNETNDGMRLMNGTRLKPFKDLNNNFVEFKFTDILKANKDFEKEIKQTNIEKSKTDLKNILSGNTNTLSGD